MSLPPLLSARPEGLRFALTYITPAIAGFAVGATLGLAMWAWVVANILAVVGGIGAGFEHDGAREGARRGAIGGLCFGLGLVLADALVVDDRVATIADPPILQPIVTVLVGTALGALGGALRHRAMLRTAAATAV